MQALFEKNRIYLGTVKELDPVKTFECGQCFRWNADKDGVYTGVAAGHLAHVYREGNDVYISCSCTAFDDVWYDYFDLGLDYEAIRTSFDAGDYLRQCADFGAGIRILHQDRWEALCSFIISQCNNIPRIKKIVETLCACFGEELTVDGETYRTFPTAERLAVLTADDLAPLRSGYRAPYIINAAQAVASGELDLDYLANTDSDTAMKALLSLNGVGVKVANCAILFGLGHMEAFPIDVWMKRALKEHFPPDFDPSSLGRYAGLAQQYIFYYSRSGGNGANV